MDILKALLIAIFKPIGYIILFAIGVLIVVCGGVWILSLGGLALIPDMIDDGWTWYPQFILTIDAVIILALIGKQAKKEYRRIQDRKRRIHLGKM